MTGTATKIVKCLRCGRTLTSKKSITLSYGPTCKARIAAAAMASADRPAQIARAVELIETGGIVAIRQGRAFRVIASNGVDRYSATASNCSCPAGVHGRRCYHQVAVELVAVIPTRIATPVNPFADAA